MKYLVICLICLFSTVDHAFAESPETQNTYIKAEPVTALLDQLGGQEQWANAKGAYVFEVHVSKWSRLPYTHEVWVDFESPRVLVRVKNQDLRQLRSLNHDDGWWIQEGEIKPYESDFQEDEKKRWISSAYRVLHLLAIEHPEISHLLSDDNILDVSLNGTPILKFELDAEFKPLAYSRFNDDFKSRIVVGEIEGYGDVKLWKQVGAPGADFVSHNLQFKLLRDGPQISFDPPEDLNNLDR